MTTYAVNYGTEHSWYRLMEAVVRYNALARHLKQSQSILGRYSGIVVKPGKFVLIRGIVSLVLLVPILLMISSGVDKILVILGIAIRYRHARPTVRSSRKTIANCSIEGSVTEEIVILIQLCGPHRWNSRTVYCSMACNCIERISSNHWTSARDHCGFHCNRWRLSRYRSHQKASLI